MITATVTCLYAKLVFVSILILWISDTLIHLFDCWIMSVFE